MTTPTILKTAPIDKEMNQDERYRAIIVKVFLSRLHHHNGPNQIEVFMHISDTDLAAQLPGFDPVYVYSKTIVGIDISNEKVKLEEDHFTLVDHGVAILYTEVMYFRSNLAGYTLATAEGPPVSALTPTNVITFPAPSRLQ